LPLQQVWQAFRAGNDKTRTLLQSERKQEEKKDEEKDYFYQEIAYGKFSHTLLLLPGVDTEHIKARYQDGVVEIMMPAP